MSTTWSAFATTSAATADWCEEPEPGFRVPPAPTPTSTPCPALCATTLSAAAAASLTLTLSSPSLRSSGHSAAVRKFPRWTYASPHAFENAPTPSTQDVTSDALSRNVARESVTTFGWELEEYLSPAAFPSNDV